MSGRWAAVHEQLRPHFVGDLDFLPRLLDDQNGPHTFARAPSEVHAWCCILAGM